MIRLNLLKPKWSGTMMALKVSELLEKWHDVGRTLPTGIKFIYNNNKIELKCKWEAK